MDRTLIPPQASVCQRDTARQAKGQHVEPAPRQEAANSQTHSAISLPYAQRQHVRDLLLQHRENAAFHLQDRHVLKHHCAFCKQWIADASKMKNHYRQSHASLYTAFLAEAAKLCSRFNTPGAPCEHCGTHVKATRQHPAKCTVLWQICVLHLSKCSEPPGMEQQLAECFGPVLKEQLAALQMEVTNGGPKREAQEAPVLETRMNKAPRKGAGKGDRSGRLNGAQANPGRKSTDGPHLLPLVKALCKLSLQQETAIKVLQQDTAWVLFLQPGETGALKMLFKAAQTWKEAHQQNQVTCPLRMALMVNLVQLLAATLKAVEPAAAQATGLMKKATENHWIDPHNHTWVYQKWSPSTNALVVNESRTALHQDRMLADLETLTTLLQRPHMVHRFHSRRPLTADMSNITTFQLEISNRPHTCLRILLPLAS